MIFFSGSHIVMSLEFGETLGWMIGKRGKRVQVVMGWGFENITGGTVDLSRGELKQL